jgi:large subunit ribosomal protein L7/L12
MPRETSLERLYERHAQLQEQIKRKEQKLKAQERKRDTKTKVLIGAMIQACLDKGVNVRITNAADLKAYMDRFLTRDYERSLFDLPPRAAKTESPKNKEKTHRSKQSLTTKDKKENVHLPLERQSIEQQNTNPVTFDKTIQNHITVAEQAASVGRKAKRLREVPIEATELQDEFNL